MFAFAQTIVALFGVVIVLMSLWGLAFPQRLLRAVRSVMDKNWGMFFAVTVRIILGLSLLIAAPGSRFPFFVAALGWLTLLAAAALPVVGRRRLTDLLGWFQRRSNTLIRLWLVVGVLLGAFLIYAVLSGFG